MSHSLSLKCFACWMVLGAVWSWSSGEAAEPRIYIMTDLEGASGVYKFAQTREPDPQLGERAKEYLMEDIRYVVRGLRAGGATDILVVDGHGSQAFVPHLMEPGAKYLTGQPRPDVSWGLDESFAGLVQVGAHAMMGTPDGVLCHTQSSRSENRYWYNGVESGELAQCAAIAGHFGVPTIMVTRRRSDVPGSDPVLRPRVRDGGGQAGRGARGRRALSRSKKPTKPCSTEPSAPCPSSAGANPISSLSPSRRRSST